MWELFVTNDSSTVIRICTNKHLNLFFETGEGEGHIKRQTTGTNM